MFGLKFAKLKFVDQISLKRIRKTGELEQSYQEKEQIEQHGKPKS